MKKGTFKFILVTLLGLIVLVASCSKSEIGILSEESQPFSNPLAELGDMHNHAMDSLIFYNISLDELEIESFEFVERKFLENYDIPVNSMGSAQMDFLTTIKQQAVDKLKNPQTRSELSEELNALTSELSDIEAVFIVDIFSLISQNMNNEIEINNAFSLIDEAIDRSDLTSDEKDGLWAVSAIAKSSYIYNVNANTTRVINIEGVITTDAQSALAGLLSWKRVAKSVASGLVFGPSGIVIAMAKEVTTAAIVGSGIYAVAGFI